MTLLIMTLFIMTLLIMTLLTMTLIIMNLLITLINVALHIRFYLLSFISNISYNNIIISNVTYILVS
jgi:hypothetical protein